MVKVYPEAPSNHVRSDPGKRAEAKLYDTLSRASARRLGDLLPGGVAGTHNGGWRAARWRN